MPQKHITVTPAIETSSLFTSYQTTKVSALAFVCSSYTEYGDEVAVRLISLLRLCGAVCDMSVAFSNYEKGEIVQIKARVVECVAAKWLQSTAP